MVHQDLYRIPRPLIYVGLGLFDLGLLAYFSFSPYLFIPLFTGATLASIIAIFGIFHLGDILGGALESMLKATWRLRGYSDS